MGRLVQKFKKLDFIILFVLACFMASSTAVIYSATMNTKYEGLHKSNLVMYALFIVPMLMTALFDYRILMKRIAYFLYGLGICLLLLVMLKGADINGAVRWINLGFTQFQPSELVKLFTIILIASFLKKRDGLPLRLKQDILPLFAITMIPVLFVLKQPDLGTAIVFICILIGMLWMANVRVVHVLTGTLIVVIVVGTLICLYFLNFDLFSKIIRPHQLARIQTFLDPAGSSDGGWHVVNSIHAIGTGRFIGEGFMKGYFVQQGYIPYDYADSIYVVIGEEFGFLGSAVLLLLYFVLIYRMVWIVMHCSELSGAYIVVGVISMLTVQIFENIAMHIGLMPLTGIALPFISYGGSSLLTNMIAVGLVMSVQIHQSEPTLLEGY